MPEKKILEVSVDEKDGEYIIHVRGERAAEIMKRFARFGCCCRSGDESKTAAECC